MNAETRAELTCRRSRPWTGCCRALKFRVPQWYKNKYTVAYFDMFEHPEQLPPYALGELDLLVVQRREGRKR